MASLSKTYDSQKLLGQIYTPRFIVDKILDDIGYTQVAVFAKTILDPSCGDGRFLCVLAERILATAPKKDWVAHLQQIHGWDIDAEAIAACKKNLDAIIAPYSLHVEWNLRCFNPIRDKAEIEERFDFIVGNPPYIRIQHLEAEERNFIQAQYDFCKKGSTDIYIAFFELAYTLLSKKGLCAMITPNTYFYTETGKALRLFFEKNKNLLQVTNYGAIQLFENATTYSAISIFGKKAASNFRYEEAKDKETFLERHIPFSEIAHTKQWALSIQPMDTTQGTKLKDICRIHVGVTTLCDKAYILKYKAESENTMTLESRLAGIVELEKAILKPIVKASKLKSAADPIEEYILFPYEKRDGKTQIIPEKALKKRFPKAYAYLRSVKVDLDKRDAGKPNKVAWYAFGRSQGLETSFGAKILFSPMNKAPNFIFHAVAEATFYSGYCMKFDGDYDWLLSQINSERMAQYVNRSARDFQGGWKAYNKRMLEDFIVESTNE